MGQDCPSVRLYMMHSNNIHCITYLNVYVFLGHRRRPYIVFSFRLLYGFVFVTRIYIYIPQSVVTGGNGGVTIRVGSETEVCGILV